MPLQRREAKGRLGEIRGEMGHIRLEGNYIRDRIVAEVATTHAALRAAFQEAEMAGGNVRLASELLEAEAERFAQGASDFLALQIREQASFDARIKAIDAMEYYHRSLVAFQTACANF